jgi:CheY-like chemotaxis protein
MDGSTASSVIQGMQVFVVEDEALIALMLEDMLTDLGCVLAGSADTVARALSQLAEMSDIDAAILDVNIGGEVVFPVADALLQRQVPFVFSTGFGPADLAARYPNSRMLAKPYPSEALAAVLAGIRGDPSTAASHA